MGIFALLREYKVANAGEVRRSGNLSATTPLSSPCRLANRRVFFIILQD